MDLKAPPTGVAPDSADALDLTPSRLTLTFGFGPGLFDGSTAMGLKSKRPEALVDLPKFTGDEISQQPRCGDLSAYRPAPTIRRSLSMPSASWRGWPMASPQLRWTQTGFLPDTASGETPRNLMGFKDGTDSPLVNARGKTNAGTIDQVVWLGADAPAWMQGGTYLVARRIRMALEHWDKTELDFQEQVIGRRKYSGAPLTGQEEYDDLKLDANDPDGNPIIPENAHVRLANAATNDGARILRRGYSYNDGTNITAERWPPWRQGLEYDVGLLVHGLPAQTRAPASSRSTKRCRSSTC